MSEHFDTGSIIIIFITFVLFVVALFTKGFTHTLLLEAGVFLVSVKLILMAYKNSIMSKEITKDLQEIKKMIEYKKSANQKHRHRGKSSERYLNKDIILKALNIGSGQTILDAGCGNGYMSKEFSKLLNHTGKVYALDPDKAALEILNQETKGTNIETIEGDITQRTRIKGSSVDLIYLSTVFHGFSEGEIHGFQKEVKRLLKPNGILSIVEIKKEKTPFGPPLHIRFSPDELKATIALIPKSLVEVGEYFYMQTFENIENIRGAS